MGDLRYSDAKDAVKVSFEWNLSERTFFIIFRRIGSYGVDPTSQIFMGDREKR